MLKRSYNAISQCRVDVGDLRSIESAGRADFDDLFKSIILGENQSYILRGFDINMTGAIGSSANALQMIVAESALLHGTSTLAGTVQVIASGTANEVLNSTTNTRVSGSFTPNATNYVGLEYTRQVDNSTVSQRMAWDPTNKVEIAKTLPLAEIFDYQIVISSSLFAANVCPIAIVVTDTANNVLSVTDRRPMLFRLGTAGYSSPDPAYVYPWDHDVEGRLENPYTSTSATSPFKGGDKMLLQFKEWMDAVMSKLKELGGTTYWYTFSSSIEDTLKFINSSIIPLADTVKFIWQNGTLSITDELAASTDATNELQIKLIGSSQLIYLTKELNISIADNEVLYVTLPTTGNRTYDGVGVADTNYKVGSADTFTKDGYNYWLAYRSGNRLTIRGLGEIENGATKEMGNYTYEPSGFVNRTDSQMSFVDGTRTFTVEPVATYFEFFVKGAKFTKTTAQTKVISDTEGLHFLYFDDEGILQETTSMTKAIITESAYVAVIYWDATANASYYMGDERHGISMDGETHYYLHTVLGAQYGAGAAISGLVGDGTGDVDGDLTFALTATDVIDEDIRQTLDAKAEADNIPKFYRDDTGAWKKVGTADPYPGYSTGSANGRCYWNDQTFAGGLVEIGQGNFVLGHIAATNDPDMPYIVILGQEEYGTVTAARAGAESELSSLVTVGLPTTELVFLYTVILQTNSGYASTIKARIRTIDSATEVDWRVTNYNGITAPSTATRFIDLTDTPASYTGSAEKPVRVNLTGDGLEFGASPHFSKARNATGGALAANKGMKITGDYPTDNILTVGLITAVTNKCIGITTDVFADGTNMDLLTKGRLPSSGLDTQLATVGDFVYLDATGSLSLIPSILQVGQVETLAASGTVYINVDGMLSGQIVPTYTNTDTITAFAGGGQLNATVLSSMVNRITVCATDGDSCKLPTSFAEGSEIAVINDGAAIMALYPASGDTINDAPADMPVFIASGSRLILKSTTSNSAWRSIAPIQLEHIINNYTIEPTTNNSFSSDAEDKYGLTGNNPYGLFFDDGRARYGIERIQFAGLVEIKDNNNMPIYDNNGKKGYNPINSATGLVDKRIGFYGNFSFLVNSGGFHIYNTTSGDYVIFTDILNKANLLTVYDGTADVLSVYLDGVDTTNNITVSGSNILTGKYYNPNQIANINIGVASQGIHTIKLVKDDANPSYFYGIEIVNEAHSLGHEICVPACKYNIRGKEVSFAAYTGANALPLLGTTDNGGQALTGTKGGFVGYYPSEIGVYISKAIVPTETIQSGVCEDNGAGSDTIDTLSGDSAVFYANSQGNIIRVYDATYTDRLLLVPTSAPDGSSITIANDYDGVADTTLLAGNKQFQDDGTTGVTFADEEGVTIELYAKIGVNANHTNEELYTVKAWDRVKNKIIDRSRTVHFGDFGNQRSDDFTSVTGTSSDLTFTMDDGSTTLVGEDCVVSNDRLVPNTNADFWSLTFYGTGIDLENAYNNVGIMKIASDLPIGFHTLKLLGTAGNGQIYLDGILIITLGYAAADLRMFNYLIYRPKKPDLTENHEYSFINYILANYVKTNLPTLALASYNGAIDQGVIRKGNAREHVYTGTWTYNATVNSSMVSGRDINTATDTNSVAIQALMSGYFRTWIYFNNAGDDEYVNVDGANQQTNNPGSAAWYGWSYITANPTEGLHTINRIAHRTAGTLYFQDIDYHAPVFNQFYNLANPFPDYIMGQTGILDNRKLVAYDVRNRRIIQISSTVSASTAIPTTDLFLCSLACDLENAELYALYVWAKIATDANDTQINIYKDGTLVGFGWSGGYGNAQNGESISSNKTANFIKRQRITVGAAASNASKYEYTQDGFLKIEEKD